MLRIPQPPINPQARDREAHGPWAAALLIVLGVAASAFGVLRTTGVETKSGDIASEMQVNQAMVHGGVTDRAKEPPRKVPWEMLPPELREAGAPPVYAEVPQEGKARFRIDLSAKAACPT